jgi:hypothetical protein
VRGCCQTGTCATHLAEAHPAGGHVSTVHLGNGIAHFGDTPSQELSTGAAIAAYALGLRILGLDPEAFVAEDRL